MITKDIDEQTWIDDEVRTGEEAQEVANNPKGIDRLGWIGPGDCAEATFMMLDHM